MDFRKFILTGFRPRGMNLYITELLNDLIKDISEKSIEEEEALDALLSTDHMFLSQYVDIPRGIEGDHCIREIVEQLEIFFREFTNGDTFYYEELKRRYDNNQETNITPTEEGIWITI